MQWSEIASILIMLLLLGWCFGLMRQNTTLKSENIRLLKKSGEYDEMKETAKEILTDSNEVETIKSLREKYYLSLVDAKEIVDAVKNKQDV